MNSIATFFSGNIAYAFAWTMIHSLWQCTLVAVVLAVSLRITRNHSASLRYLQGLFALFICVLVSAITFFRYYSDIASINQALLAFSTDLNIAYVGSLWEQIYVKLNSVLHYVVLLWLFGFAIQFYRYSYDFVRALALGSHCCESVGNEWTMHFNRLSERLDLTKNFTVKNSSRITSICTIGHFKPIILLPIGLLITLPTDQVEALVLHELAHIKRNDYLVNIVQCFVRLIYFFNPAVIWISSRIDLERENACDDIAVNCCGNPSLYADSLANISELELNMMTVLAAKKSKYPILSRVKRLFSNSSSLSKSMEQLISALCACFVVVTMNVSAADFNILNADNIHKPSATESTDSAFVVIPMKNSKTPLKMAMQDIEQPVAVPSAPLKKSKMPLKMAGQDIEQPVAVPLTSKPENKRTPATKLRASPELDYVSTLIAMHEEATASPAKPVVKKMQLAGSEKLAQAQTSSKPRLESIESNFDTLSVATAFKLPLSRKIYIEDAQVSFSKDWLLTFGGTDRYQKMIIEKYGASYIDNLKNDLIAAGWKIVNAPGADTVRVNPQIVDLYITAPEEPGSRHTIVASFGNAKTELIFKTPENQPFMKIIDQRRTPNKAGAEANRGSNYRSFNKLMEIWSKGAVYYLEQIMTIVENKKSG